MSNIAIPQTITVIEFKDGTTLSLQETPEQVMQKLQKQFVLVGDTGFNSFEVKKRYKQDLNDMEQYILAITDKVMRGELRGILQERKDKNLKTNGIPHLLEIYETRKGQK